MKFHWQHPDLLMVEAHLYHLLIVKFPFQNKKHLCQESQILTETKQCKAKVRLRTSQARKPVVRGSCRRRFTQI